MRLFLLIALILAAAPETPAGASDDQADAGCQGSTVEVTECLGKAVQPWDERLNTAYQAVLKRDTPARREALVRAEHAWMAYRDANCGWYGEHEGTIREILYPQCRLTMTRNRTLELEGALPSP